MRLTLLLIFLNLCISSLTLAQDSKPATAEKKDADKNSTEAQLKKFVLKLDKGFNGVLAGQKFTSAFNKEAMLENNSKLSEEVFRKQAQSLGVKSFSLAGIELRLYFTEGKTVAFEARGMLYQNSKGLRILLYSTKDHREEKRTKVVDSDLLPQQRSTLIDPLAKAINTMYRQLSDKTLTFEDSQLITKRSYFDGDLEKMGFAPKASQFQDCVDCAEKTIDYVREKTFNQVVVDIDDAGWIGRDKAKKHVATAIVDTQVPGNKKPVEVSIKKLVAVKASND